MYTSCMLSFQKISTLPTFYESILSNVIQWIQASETCIPYRECINDHQVQGHPHELPPSLLHLREYIIS